MFFLCVNGMKIAIKIENIINEGYETLNKKIHIKGKAKALVIEDKDT